MKLSEILKECKTNFFLENFYDFNIIDLSADSRIIKNNYIFAAISGKKENGENYIKNILKYKKIAIILSKNSKKNIKVKNTVLIRTTKVRKLFSEIASIVNKNSIKEKVAITGTNGKTSISDYTRQIWEKLNFRAASIGTLGLIYKKNKIDKSPLTTPDSVILNKQLNLISKKKCEKLVIEASSIGLEQSRLFPIKFDKVAFSNLSRDHLDYHKNFYNYKKSKSLLFTEHTKKKSIAIINTDNRFSDFFFNVCKEQQLKILDYGKTGKFLKISTFQKKSGGFEYQILLKNRKKKIFTKAISEYEVYNKLCALILIFGEKLEFSNFNLLNSLKNPPGRLDKVKKNWNIFVDYAHTPDALNNVLSNLKKNCKGNLFTIIGCGGDRDKEKRPLMSKEALKFSDLVIITDDNPRNEDPGKIRKDMIRKLTIIDKKKVKEIADRKKAITFTVKLLKKNDFLLIAGKGHENYQIIGNKRNFFSDKEVVKQIISKLK
ncbi:MAG: UDP-N-acetylmuramoyl-L-alanyl-D-glutamate--2,6-diaminopimelate ligase [Alphaproteobacteria bacterium]|nr:UDP-N-acetylmuramoyl-L-alanyl-D-glutamate--2,6-diaminopimelate ligase [Alphaproteobacteria bacterium]